MAIRVRRGLDIDRLTVILEEGEVAFTTDTQMFYVGDNVTLGGIFIGPGAAAPTAWGTITGLLVNQIDLQAALNSKEPTITAGLITDYWRGDKSWQPFPSIPSVTPAALTRVDDTNVTLTLGGTPSTSLLQATSLTLGWTGTLADTRIASSGTWNAKQDAITLTTIGTSGAATLIGATLNIPQYTDTYVGTVTSVAALTLGTTGVDLSSTVANSTTTPVITLNVPTASTLNRGALSAADWTTFNSKQGAITLTTTGTTGASTFIANTLNIPSYADQFVGTVTSVGLTVPTAFSVTGSPITTSGTLAITGAGLVSQYIDGTGALQTFPALSSGTVTNVATAGLISGGPITTTGTITTSMTTNRLVGRGTALSGVMEEIILGTNLSLTGTTLNATGGTVSPLTTKGDLYTYDTTNARLPVGLDTQILLADSSTTTGLKWGTNTAATPLGYYGAFQDNTTQTATTINTPYAMKFGIIDLSNGITIVSDGSNLTRITIANTGIYNIQFSAQFDRTNSGTDAVDIWLRKNGVDVPGSSGKIILTGGAAASAIIAAWNYVLDIVAGDYYQLMWSTPDTHVRLLYEPAQTIPFAHPIIPSTILTVTQQSGIMAGTGITAINSLTGAAQTIVAGTSGTDFAVSSVGTTHTLNLPTASALNRGALSSADWTTFNNKGSGTVTSVAATVPTFLSVSGSPITTSGTLAVTLSGTALPVLNGGTGVTTSTGSGDTVLSTSPTLVTPILGSASATALTFTSTAVSGSTINKLTTAQRQALTPVIGDVVYDTTIGTTCTYNGTFWEYTKEYYATTNVSTTTTLASNITGLTTFTLEANSSYNINGQFLIGCTASGGVKFGNTLPAGAVSLYYINGISTSGVLFLQAASSNGTLTASGINRVNGTSTMIFGGVINIGATAGTVSMQFASATGGQTSTVYGLFASGYQSKITLTKIA